MRKSIISGILAILLVISFLGRSVFATETPGLTEEQKTSVDMLNYLAVLTQEINESKNILIFIPIVIIDQIFLLVFGFSLMNADSNTLIGSVATIILSLLYFSSWNFLISISTEWIKEKKQ